MAGLVEKHFRDPVHGFITIRHPLLLQLIDSPEFQRLRRVRQLGSSFGTYHGAEHSRFGHCLGALHIMTQIIRRFRDLGIYLDERVELVATCAALLHDVGHGAFSHSLEDILTPGVDHEMWTHRILTGDTHLHHLLAEYDPKLPADVVAVLQGHLPAAPFVVSLVTGQMDVDRMDYLLRDALFTGTLYGQFDLDRLIATLTVIDNQVALMRKGISAAEEYVLARYHMYWQVYFHKTTRGQDVVLKRAWERARTLALEGRLGAEGALVHLAPFLHGQAGLMDYLRVDDTDIWYALKLWATRPDPILSDLSHRFLNRRLLKSIFKEPKTDVKLERSVEAFEVLRARGWEPHYYFVVDRTSDIAYDYYTEEEREGRKPILVLDEAERPREISKLSDPIRAIAGRRRTAQNIYVPADCRDEVAGIFRA